MATKTNTTTEGDTMNNALETVITALTALFAGAAVKVGDVVGTVNPAFGADFVTYILITRVDAEPRNGRETFAGFTAEPRGYGFGTVKQAGRRCGSWDYADRIVEHYPAGTPIPEAKLAELRARRDAAVASCN
jgi:hypothetical protein